MEYWSDGFRGTQKTTFSVFNTHYSSTPTLHHSTWMPRNRIPLKDPLFQDVLETPKSLTILVSYLKSI
jgi:hypothetical protein